MLERLTFFIGFVLLLIAVVPAWRWQQRRRLAQLGCEPAPAVVQALDLPLHPTILYFTTATCSQCKFQQTPVLERLSKVWGEAVHVRKLDAIEHEALAQHFGLLTVPSTVVLDPCHRPVAVNHGLATAERLSAQVTSAFESAAVAPAHSLPAPQSR